MSKELLLGKTQNELKEIVKTLGMPLFTAGQIAEWMYKKRVNSFDEMTNISVKNRNKLAEQFEVGGVPPTNRVVSKDGTIKYLFKTSTGNFIETVYIPEKERATLCVSIQVGCKMNCYFCMTGKQGFTAQLSVNEVINQMVSIPEFENLTNVVFMGMGEPFDNVDELLKALEIITSDYGFGWSPKRITVSTIGVIPGLKRFLEESNCNLAISLHSPFAEERQKLMPIERKYPITDVLDLIRQYDFAHQRRVSFEYIMFAGLNDTMRHAVKLKSLLKGIPCRVNLIRFHEIPTIELKTSDSVRMTEFQNYLNENGVITTIRKSRGQDIDAACGLLSTKEQNKKNHQ